MRAATTIAVRFVLCTAVIFGLIYPLALTGFARLVLPRQANGDLLTGANGKVIGSRWIGQNFTGPTYFHGRPSAAGAGYDASSSGGSNYAASSQKLVTRIQASVATNQGDSNHPVPIDLVTTSGSGLDPDITPAAALYQVHRVASARGLSEQRVQQLVLSGTTTRQFGFMGEPRVNVLALNLALDREPQAPPAPRN